MYVFTLFNLRRIYICETIIIKLMTDVRKLHMSTLPKVQLNGCILRDGGLVILAHIRQIGLLKKNHKMILFGESLYDYSVCRHLDLSISAILA